MKRITFYNNRRRGTITFVTVCFANAVTAGIEASPLKVSVDSEDRGFCANHPRRPFFAVFCPLNPQYLRLRSTEYTSIYCYRQRPTGIRPTTIVPENENMIFQYFGRLILPGTLNNVPCSLNELQCYSIGQFSRGI